MGRSSESATRQWTKPEIWSCRRLAAIIQELQIDLMVAPLAELKAILGIDDDILFKYDPRTRTKLGG